MSSREARVLFDGLLFPEGPRWHGDRLWLSDQHAHRVWRLDLEGGAEVVAELGDCPSGIGFLPDGTPLVAEMRTQRILRIGAAGELEVHADLSSFRAGWVNEMIVDAAGRAYIGHNRGRYGEGNSEPGELVLVEPDGAARVVADDLRGPNGTAITPDGRTLLLSVLWERRVLAFDIDDDGSVTGKRTWAPDVQLDGICLDADGALWGGTAMGKEFVRVAEGGEILERLPREHWCIACVLAGHDRQTLCLLIADVSTEKFARLAAGAPDHESGSRGRVELVRVDVPGAGVP